MTKPIMTLAGVRQNFITGLETEPVITDASLTLTPGHSTALSGPAASGKTTLLEIITCLRRPTAGDVVFDGRHLGRLSSSALAEIRRHHIGIVPASPFFNDHQTVEQALRVAAIIGGQPRSIHHALVLAAARAAGLTRMLPQHIATLSDAQRLRTAIARAIVCRPQVLAIDDPFPKPTPDDYKTFGALMRGVFAHYRIAIVYTTQSHELATVADEFFTLSGGKLS